MQAGYMGISFGKTRKANSSGQHEYTVLSVPSFVSQQSGSYSHLQPGDRITAYYVGDEKSDDLSHKLPHRLDHFFRQLDKLAIGQSIIFDVVRNDQKITCALSMKFEPEDRRRVTPNPAVVELPTEPPLPIFDKISLLTTYQLAAHILKQATNNNYPLGSAEQNSLKEICDYFRKINLGDITTDDTWEACQHFIDDVFDRGGMNSLLREMGMSSQHFFWFPTFNTTEQEARESFIKLCYTNDGSRESIAFNTRAQEILDKLFPILQVKAASAPASSLAQLVSNARGSSYVLSADSHVTPAPSVTPAAACR